MGVGWDMGLMGLAEHLTGTAGGRSGARRGVGRVRGRPAFAHACSEAWADASIAAGTPADAARAAAGRTTAFYTGAQPPAGG